MTSSYEHRLTEAAPEAQRLRITEQELWDNFEWFLQRAVPVAEKAGVKLALHPDDPPLSPVMGVPRLFSSVDGFERGLGLIESEANGMCYCQGNFSAMGVDIPETIRLFGAKNVVHFVHVVSNGNGAALQGEGWGYPLSALNARRARRSSSREVVVGARHSTIEVHTDARRRAVPGRVYTVEPTGDVTYAHVYLGSTIVVVSVAPGLCLAADDRVWIDFDQARLHLFDGRTEQALTADA